MPIRPATFGSAISKQCGQIEGFPNIFWWSINKHLPINCIPTQKASISWYVCVSVCAEVKVVVAMPILCYKILSISTKEIRTIVFSANTRLEL